MAHLPALKAGGPYELTVAGKNRIALADVMIGEVWSVRAVEHVVAGWELDPIPEGQKPPPIPASGSIRSGRRRTRRTEDARMDTLHGGRP